MNHISIRDHYELPDLLATILEALVKAGIDPDGLTRDDLANFDEFHIGGRRATEALVRLASLQAGQTVLDLGSGIGGPARHLAATIGCRVTGLDLIPEYCRTATELTRRVGLTELVDFRTGDMIDLPFGADTFDRVWSQHTTMNIADMGALVNEIGRVLRPSGRVVFHEICTASDRPLDLPVPWASRPEHSHLVSTDEFRASLAAAGLTEKYWADTTNESIAWFERLAAEPRGDRRPNLGLLMGPTAGRKSRNLARNLREGSIVVIQGVWSA